MSRAIVVQAGQRSILIETDESVEVPPHLHGTMTPSAPGAPERVGEGVDGERVKRTFAEIKDLITTCCNNLFEAIDSVGDKPDKFTVEFGVKLAGEAGVPMLTKEPGGANFKVSIEWRRG